MKNKEINILELFSGIGGFSKGFEEAGYNLKNHYFSEVDKHAIANYKYNFPNAKHLGSVTNVYGRDLSHIDIITFGSPCQDFSLAGKQLGMEGERSVLILEAIRIIRECRPSVFIWENVKGVFSSNNGADFWAVLAAFANIGGYRLEWQLLNTSWFLPQNRERIYLVGHLANRSECGVFPITESNGIHYKPIENQKEIHEDSLCLTSKGNSNNTGSFVKSVKVAHVSRTDEAKEIRRESMKNGKDYTPFQGKKLEFKESDVMNTITCATQKDNLIQTDNIRRLTEIECERLQGFSDNWTKWGIYEKQVWINKKENTFKIIEEVNEIPKTQRYKMCGNAVTVAVVKCIALRIMAI